MFYLAIKAALSGILAASVSEIDKRSPAFGALVASLPLISIMAVIWLWRDTGDNPHCLIWKRRSVRPAVATDVPRNASDASFGRQFLAELGGQLRPDGSLSISSPLGRWRSSASIYEN